MEKVHINHNAKREITRDGIPIVFFSFLDILSIDKFQNYLSWYCFQLFTSVGSINSGPSESLHVACDQSIEKVVSKFEVPT